LWANGLPVPLASAVNYGASQSRPGNAVVPVSLPVRAEQAAGTTTHFILDVTGYFQ
jgi:hypothetical protein